MSLQENYTTVNSVELHSKQQNDSALKHTNKKLTHPASALTHEEYVHCTPARVPVTQRLHHLLLLFFPRGNQHPLPPPLALDVEVLDKKLD